MPKGKTRFYWLWNDEDDEEPDVSNSEVNYTHQLTNLSSFGYSIIAEVKTFQYHLLCLRDESGFGRAGIWLFVF